MGRGEQLRNGAKRAPGARPRAAAGQVDVAGQAPTELIYDWNELAPRLGLPDPERPVEFNDETLRDGLQCPSVRQPSLVEKREFLRQLPRIGVDAADIGYAGASPEALRHVVGLARTIADERLPIRANCAGRTHVNDIDPIVEAQQRSGVPIDAALFIGSSPIRQLVEEWDVPGLARTAEQAVSYAVRAGLEVMFVTEDTTRARREDVATMYLAAAEAGAKRFCISDTVGQAMPSGVQQLVQYVAEVLASHGFADAAIDWHGHRDRGLDVMNALAALAAGARRVHGCALGIGERVGNTALDLVLVNIALLGWRELDLLGLPDYCRIASEMTGVPIPRNYPVLGRDAFSTSTGVHAAAVAKAYAKGDSWLADRVYSAVPASLVGRSQEISIGPMSGKSNVVYWLRAHGFAPGPKRLEAILAAAKSASRVLADDEVVRIVEAAGRRPAKRPPDKSAATTLALLSGNEAVALGAYHSGVTVATGYPGTPSTEVLEHLARISEADEVDVDWSTNEKVALDVGIGAALAGARVLVTMKHVGLNVAMDSLMTSAFIGVKGGLVLMSADDPGMHSSQNAQDNRYLGRFAGLPVFEPADSQEAYDFVQAAFETSERFDLPCLLRMTTRTSHARSKVQAGSRKAAAGEHSFTRDPSKYVMLPAYARQRHVAHLARLDQLQAWVEEHPFTVEELRSRDVGVVTAGISYHHVREVLPDASVLKLGIEFPLPGEAIRRFAAKVDRLLVVEELEPYLEEEIRRLGIPVEGKKWVPRAGELSAAAVRKSFVAAGLLDPSAGPIERPDLPAVGPRPPVLCPGCPHSTPYLALGELDAIVAGDIGCYTLAAGPPITSMDTCLAMGSSIGMAIGLALSGRSRQPVVATIGDSTFFHGGIPALLDAIHRQANITVVILDNGTTAMTGGQPHPGIASDIRGRPALAADIAELCRACGVASVATVDPYDVAATRRALRGAIAQPGVAVVVTSRACVEAPVKSRGPVYVVRKERCDGCQACMRIGCPAISWDLEAGSTPAKVKIDAATCSGCTICAQLCPSRAIVSVREVAASAASPGPATLAAS